MSPILFHRCPIGGGRIGRLAVNGSASETQDAVRIEPVDGRASLDRFIRLPWSVYADDANWVPPLLMERRAHLSAKTNPFFAHADVKFWLAYRGSRCSGRISAQVNHAHLEAHNDATGHFGFLEAEDDSETFHALLDAAERWLREKQMRRVRGPFSFSINDESGVLVDGFDTPPSLMMGHAFPYYATRIEEQGYVKAKDLIAYDYEIHHRMPSPAKALVDRVRESREVTLRPLQMSRYKEDIGVILDIFNDAWSRNWGFVPLSEAESQQVAKDLKPLVRADLVCIAEVEGEPAAMAVSLPNLNEAIADLNGSLFPWGWLKLLWRLKVGGLRTARVMLMGVRRRHHGTPLGAALAFAVIDAIRAGHERRGFKKAELSWVLEDNTSMCRVIDSIGGRPYKTYRIYQKALD
ncbi:MAG: N-acetyltransferase [Alphaproteobacteria bacterium]